MIQWIHDGKYPLEKIIKYYPVRIFPDLSQHWARANLGVIDRPKITSKLSTIWNMALLLNLYLYGRTNLWKHKMNIEAQAELQRDASPVIIGSLQW